MGEACSFQHSVEGCNPDSQQVFLGRRSTTFNHIGKIIVGIEAERIHSGQSTENISRILTTGLVKYNSRSDEDVARKGDDLWLRR